MAPQQSSRFDPNFTNNVINAMGPKTDPRTRQVFTALLRHVHDFTREVELTTDEWMAGVHFINAIGQISDAKRNEGQRISDVIGLEFLVDEIAHKLATESPDDAPTSSSILGPFCSPHAPWRENGESVILSPHNGHVVSMHGVVSDFVTKKPIPNATFDFWQASSNGKYDLQDPDNQVDNNLRGKFKTNEKGEYHLYCLQPTAYSLPTDPPAGTLFNLLDRHPFRPAHIHLMVSHPDYKQVVTQIFPKDDPYLATDTVFAVKGDLAVDFVPMKEDPKAELELTYNVILVPKGYEGIASAPEKSGDSGVQARL